MLNSRHQFEITNVSSIIIYNQASKQVTNLINQTTIHSVNQVKTLTKYVTITNTFNQVYHQAIKLKTIPLTLVRQYIRTERLRTRIWIHDCYRMMMTVMRTTMPAIKKDGEEENDDIRMRKTRTSPSPPPIIIVSRGGNRRNV